MPRTKIVAALKRDTEFIDIFSVKCLNQKWKIDRVPPVRNRGPPTMEGAAVADWSHSQSLQASAADYMDRQVFS